MGIRRPWKAGVLALTLMILMSAMTSAGTRWGASFTALSGAKVVNGALARSLGGEAMAVGSPGETAAGTLAASNAKPTGDCDTDACTGIALVGVGNVSGVGNATGGTISMEVEAIGIVVCTNNGGNQSPGINQPGISLLGQDPFGSNEVTQNGKVAFETTSSTEAIGEPLLPATAYGCPSDNWTATIVRYQFLSATMIALQYDTNGVVLQEIGRQTFDF